MHYDITNNVKLKTIQLSHMWDISCNSWLFPLKIGNFHPSIPLLKKVVWILLISSIRSTSFFVRQTIFIDFEWVTISRLIRWSMYSFKTKITKAFYDIITFLIKHFYYLWTNKYKLLIKQFWKLKKHLSKKVACSKCLYKILITISLPVTWCYFKFLKYDFELVNTS